MKSFLLRYVIFLSFASIFSVGAINCDFCPDPANLESDDSLCTELLRLARGGNLYQNEEECDFNIPILANRCKCSVAAPARHKPCNPCAAIADHNFDIDSNESSTTVTNPGGRLTLIENKKYSCIEILFSARNGGLHPSKCDHLSMSENNTSCGQCIETEMCTIDETLCRPNTIIVASNPNSFPSASNLWSTALTCQDLIEGARDGTLLSDTGCDTLKRSIQATFNWGLVDHDLFDLSSCGLQCNYDENAISLQIPTEDILVGRSDGYNSIISAVPSDGPSLQPSDGPSIHMSDMPSQKDIRSQQPSILPSMMELVRSQTSYPLNAFPESNQDTVQEMKFEKVSFYISN